MIRFYYEPKDRSSRNALDWFENMKINVSVRRIQWISREDLLLAIKLSDNGFIDILKRTSKTSRNIEIMKKKLDDMKFDEGINFILQHTEVLKVPLILDKNKLLLGYNSEEIRKFTSRTYRKIGIK